MRATQIREGQPAKIVSMTLDASEKRRLMDLGFSIGTLIERLFDAPLGGTIAFRIRGTVVALRQEQSDEIEVEPC